MEATRAFTAHLKLVCSRPPRAQAQRSRTTAVPGYREVPRILILSENNNLIIPVSDNVFETTFVSNPSAGLLLLSQHESQRYFSIVNIFNYIL